MKTAKTSNFFHDKPLFGLDIGHGSLKVMQLAERSGDPKTPPQVIGYGFTTFDTAAQENGVILQPETIAKAAHELFKNNLVGDITTRRVAIAIPAYRTFTRSLQLPKMQAHELLEAVELEAEQYIPLPLDDLYMDYEVVSQNAENIELFLVAVPRSIVNSYLNLAQIIGLETVMIEPTLGASTRLFSLVDNNDEAAFIIDFGSQSSDISIFNKQTIATGTVQGGGVNFTQAIKSKLRVSQEEAGNIKTRYGLGVSKRQPEIQQALKPTLEQLVKEIQRMLRYYEERYGNKQPIKQVITLGGGANMPGLSEYLTQALRLAVRHVDPWHYLSFKHLQPPSPADKPMYATVAGLALTDPEQVFSDD
jgi:type IV pilus assembly protein PilM